MKFNLNYEIADIKLKCNYKKVLTFFTDKILCKSKIKQKGNTM